MMSGTFSFTNDKKKITNQSFVLCANGREFASNLKSGKTIGFDNIWETEQDGKQTLNLNLSFWVEKKVLTLRLFGESQHHNN